MQIKKHIFLFSIYIVCFLTFFTTACEQSEKLKEANEVLKDMSSTRKKEFKEIEKKMKNIKIGMTKDEVESIAGKPESISTSKYRDVEEEIWIFSSPKLAAEQPRCIFNRKTERIIEVVVGDDYRLR